MDDETKKLQIEKDELNAIINKGVDFSVVDRECTVTKRWFGLRRKSTIRTVKRNYHINELTLATIDRISAESINFAIDENAMKSADGMKHVRGLAARHCRRCARIVAIAVLGEDLWIPSMHGNTCVYKEDSKRLESLTDVFFRTIQPSQLLNLYVMVQTMCNLADFANSIRLMSTDRTTMPIRIEE